LYRQAHGEDCFQHHFHPSPSIILGLPWLEAHNLIIDWRSRTLTFSAQRCTFQEPHAHKNTLSSPAKNPSTLIMERQIFSRFLWVNILII
jgi:hypothetical protein